MVVVGQGQATTLPSSFPNGRLLGDAASSNLHPRSHTLARMTRSVNAAVGNGTQAKCMGGGGDGGARAHPAGSRGDGVASRRRGRGSAGGGGRWKVREEREAREK